MNIGDHLLDVVFYRWAKLDEGCFLPWWGRILVCLVHPYFIIRYWTGGLYDPWTGCYVIQGLKLSREAFRVMSGQRTPGRWFRFLKTEHGIIYLETMEDAARTTPAKEGE